MCLRITTAALGLALVLGGAAGANDLSTDQAKRPTFYEDVLPILQQNCQVCHRPDGANLGGMVAPMAFTNYRETRPWAKAIAQNVANHTMPPWHAAPQHTGEFKNERTLTQDEIDTLVAWASTGAARGNPKEAPEPIQWPEYDGWTIGEPDLILSMPEPYFVDDDVEDIYVNIHDTITEEQLPDPRYIKALEFRPGSSVVHHIITFPLGGIAPGNDPTVYPEGIGKLLEPGTDLRWQMHYHKEPGPGTGTWDQSELAIVFYPEDADIEYELQGNHLGRFDFQIPPGESDYTLKQEYTFSADSQIVQFMPHMHLRGKAAKYEAFYPDGTHEVLLDVPRYDFNWQTAYQYKDFKEVPEGTKIVFTSVFDNSPENPYNPDPTKAIRWGEPTTDEMSFGYMSFINDSEVFEPMFGSPRRQGEPSSETDDEGNAGPSLVQVIGMFDKNGDGLLQKDEAPAQLEQYFAMIDRNGDGAIDEAEAKAADEFRRQRGDA